MKELSKDTKMIKGVLEEFASCHYSHLIKAIISFELNCNDEDVLQEAYDYMMRNDDINLLSDGIRLKVGMSEANRVKGETK